MSARTIFFAALLMGCAHRPVAIAPQPARPTVATPKRAVTTPPEKFPTFHVVARGFPGSDMLPSKMDLCPIDNAVFVCGGNRMIMLRGRDLVADEALEKGLPHDKQGRIDGIVNDLSGRFPDDFWLRLRLYAGQADYAYYRYKNGAWSHVFTPPAVGHSYSYSLSLLRRGDQPLFQETDNEAPVHFYAPNGGYRPKDGLFEGQGGILSLKDDGDMLILSVSRKTLDPELRHRFANGKTELVEFPKLATFSFTFDGDDMIGYGADESAPYLAKRIGKTWTPMDAAGINDAIRSYERFGDAEWVTTVNALYRRTPGSTFTRYELPDDRKRTWITGDNDVWILKWEGRDGVLLRTIAPTKEARFDWQ